MQISAGEADEGEAQGHKRQRSRLRQRATAAARAAATAAARTAARTAAAAATGAEGHALRKKTADFAATLRVGERDLQVRAGGGDVERRRKVDRVRHIAGQRDVRRQVEAYASRRRATAAAVDVAGAQLR